MNKQLVEQFMTLVKIDSATGDEDEITTYLLNWFKKRNIFVKKDTYGNIYAQIPGNKLPLFFSAHMDTVEPGKNIKPIIHNGYISSDGSTILGGDNKAALAAMLCAADHFIQSKIDHREIEFIFTRSEEVGNYGAIHFDYRLLHAKTGFCFDSGNPVGTIIQASPFYERFDITVKGKAAHASRPYDANNVLYFLSSFLREVTLGKLDDDSIINIGVIQGGDVRNTIPGELIIKGEIRSFIESMLLEHKNHVVHKIHKLVKQHKMKVEHEFVRENPGYKHISDKSLQMIKQTKKYILRAGLRPEIADAWGVSDANIFNKKGLLCLNLGNGVEGAHTKQERIKTGSLEKMFQLMLEISQS